MRFTSSSAEISPRYMAFAALVRSIDGKEVGSVTDDSMKEVLAQEKTQSVNVDPVDVIFGSDVSMIKRVAVV